MYIEERAGKRKSKNNLKVSSNLTFQIVFNDTTMSNNCINVPPVLLLYSVTPEVLLEEEQPYIAQFRPGFIN